MLNQALKQKTIVKPGGIVEIESIYLAPGTMVDVIVICENSNNNTPSLKKIIGTGKGCFNTPEEVDNFINQERDSWEY